MMLIVPLLVFLLAMILTRPPLRLALTLLFLCPFLACLLLMLGSVVFAAITHEFNAIYSASALGSFAFVFYLFTFPSALYPPGAWLGAGTLFAWAGCNQWFSLKYYAASRRAAVGAIMGTVVGVLFAAIIFLSYMDREFSALFGPLISIRDAGNRFPPGEVPPVTIILGFLDGLLIALNSRNLRLERQPNETKRRGTLPIEGVKN